MIDLTGRCTSCVSPLAVDGCCTNADCGRWGGPDCPNHPAPRPMAPQAPDLAAFRSRHTISVGYARRLGIGLVTVCQTDGLRIHDRRGGGHYHDPSEMAGAIR